jgi:hypothetical protein
MKFLADMGISPRTVDGLRQQGHDAFAGVMPVGKFLKHV